MSTYNQTYHSEIEESARRSAETVIKMLIRLFNPKSVADIGCGRGTWLSEWQRQGVNTIWGVDGGHQDKNRLLIPQKCFQEYDLNQLYVSKDRFDLVTCLEVAEHLNPGSDNNIIQTLTQLADIIVFSAAIPNQGGFQHINEQWPSYWAQKFEAQGFVFADGLRWHLMPFNEVSWWYRQNTFLAIRKEVYEQSFQAFPLFSPEFYVMHELVYKTYASLSHRAFFATEQFIYNNFHSFYHKIAPTVKRVLVRS
ncbi:methyltransferase domain-containing protein [Spirosoma soli]|uniref:Methyltransferase domain-containing protein n=1 Tax=Spirosoma soli TaxID=1770529 RepID=A0ABW5M6R7_9BACT